MNKISLISQNYNLKSDIKQLRSSQNISSVSTDEISFQGKKLLITPKKNIKTVLFGLLGSLYLYSKDFFKIGEDYKFDPKAKNNKIPQIPNFIPSARFEVLKEAIPTRNYGVIKASKELVAQKIQEAKQQNKKQVVIILDSKLSKTGASYNFESYKKQVLDLEENLLQEIEYKNGTKIIKNYDPETRKLISKIVENKLKYKFEYLYNDDGFTTVIKLKASEYKDSLPVKYTKSIKKVDSNGLVLNKLSKIFTSYDDALAWQGEDIDRNVKSYKYNPVSKEITIGKEILCPANIQTISKYKKILNEEVISKAMKRDIAKSIKTDQVDTSRDYARIITIEDFYDKDGVLLCTNDSKRIRYYIKDESKDSWFDIDSENGMLIRLYTDLYEDCEKIGTLKYSFRNGLISDVPEGYFEDYYRIQD